MAKTEQNLLSMNSNMTAEALEDAVDLENANFVHGHIHQFSYLTSPFRKINLGPGIRLV